MGNQAMIFNGVGMALLTVALVLHTVCLSMPYYSKADMDGFAQDLVKEAAKDPVSMGLPPQITKEEMQEVVEGLAGMAVGCSINFGMWKICLESRGMVLCVPWETSTRMDQKTGMLKALGSDGWMRGVQAMSILGMIFLFVAVVKSLINLVVQSKGDRLRLLYLVILFFSVLAAIFILIGDIIMAANHKEAFNPSAANNGKPPPAQLYAFFKDHFILSWGFALDIVSVALILLGGIAHFIGGRIANSLSGIV